MTRARGFIPPCSIHLCATLSSLFPDSLRVFFISAVRSQICSSARTEDTCFSGTIRRSVFIVSAHSRLFFSVSSFLEVFYLVFLDCEVHSLSCLCCHFRDLVSHYYSFCKFTSSQHCHTSSNCSATAYTYNCSCTSPPCNDSCS